MRRFLKSLLLPIVLIQWCCSKDTENGFMLPTPPADSCQIKHWSTPKFDRFSFEFFFESDRLTGMLMTSPSFDWPSRYTYRYTGDQLTRITQSLGATFPDYDSIVWRITYDDRGLPVSEQSTIHYAEDRQGERPESRYEFDGNRITVRDLGGSKRLFYMDAEGNIQRHERYNLGGELISFNEVEYDTNPSPFRNFPLVLQLTYSGFFDYSLINNAIKIRYTNIVDQENTVNEYTYTYNAEGYPIEFRSTEENGSYSRIMEYSNCE